jgi:outer membrane protein OmpA-like peptidoglycan-associated protein
MGKYETAKKYFENFLIAKPIENMLARRIKLQLAKCNFSMLAVQTPLAVAQKTLDFTGFCSFPVLTADKETMIFTQLVQDEDLKISYWKDGKWSTPYSLSDNINTAQNEGTASISADGRSLVFTSCNRTDGFGSCDLYFTKKAGETWSKPVNLGRGINTTWWESQPSLSADGKTLYFVSDRPKGFGNKDIYVCNLDSLNEWTVPVNLGATINTNYDDIAPFVHANGRTLFFASEGHLGFGGQDFFMTNLDQKSWTKPYNLGYPFNNAEDQIGLYISPDCSKGYYTSDNKAEGFHENSFEPNRKQKIIEFNVPDSICAKIIKTKFLKGTIIDAKTNQKIEANIELFDAKTQKRISTILSDSKTGSYTTVLNQGGTYSIFINKIGYLYKSIAFEIESLVSIPGKTLDVLLEPIQKNTKEILSNVFFASSKYDLETNSIVELDKLFNILQENPSISIEISGHTDDQGREDINQKLSLMRAKSVEDYLVKKGIVAKRLKTEGFGKQKPLVPNLNEENRKLNRRIEIKIL